VITGHWGFEVVPDDIKDAVLTMAARRAMEKNANYGDAVQQPAGGAVAYFRGLPSYVQTTLYNYRIPSLAFV
jgi:hypothetical protein